MADIVTGTVTGQLDISQLLASESIHGVANADQHADIRTEAFAQSADIRRDVLQSAADGRYANAVASSDVRREIEAAGHKATENVGREADRLVAQSTAHFIAQQQEAATSARDVAALKSLTDLSYQSLQLAIQNGIDRAAAATALEGAKNAAATALGQSVISQAIVADGNNTRALINELKMDQLNRELIERNAALVECRSDSRHANYVAQNSQLAAITSQLNAFASQLQETRQGVTNFGTMTGNAGRQNSTQNVA